MRLTDDAVTAVKDMVARAGELPSAGVRIAVERGTREVAVQFVVERQPAEDDEIIETKGARLFLEPEAAALLDDKLLDVGEAEAGPSFRFASRPSEERDRAAPR
jgi:iron-sulfur cluster assembly protein